MDFLILVILLGAVFGKINFLPGLSKICICVICSKWCGNTTVEFPSIEAAVLVLISSAVIETLLCRSLTQLHLLLRYTMDMWEC